MRAGAARVSLEPPLGLAMVGFVRRHETARGYGLPLEATALALEGADGLRVVLAGVDTAGIQAPEVDRLRERVAAATGAPVAGVLLNWNHTHCAPPGGRSLIGLGGPPADELPPAEAAYVDHLHAKVVSVARLAAERLEPARPVWGTGRLDEAVNRRERTPEGRTILGWNREGVVDTAVPVLQLRRPDETAVCTAVGYGCHTVTVGPDVLLYSADFPGPLRERVRAWTGGECVFLQGAGGNVLTRFAFTDSEAEAVRVGTALALEALHALAREEAWPTRIERLPGGSVTPFSLYRPRPADAPQAPLALAEERVAFPLLPLPDAAEVAALRAEFDAAVDAARAEGADAGRMNTVLYHASWARRTQERILAGTAPTTAEGPVAAVRIGDGAIVTGPGEIFSEIGLEVRERSPAQATLYAGYTNGAVSYFPTAAEYPSGGYEPGYGNRTYGLPAQVAPECERILVETGLRLVGSLF